MGPHPGSRQPIIDPPAPLSTHGELSLTEKFPPKSLQN